jgi:hypothetical protein
MRNNSKTLAIALKFKKKIKIIFGIEIFSLLAYKQLSIAENVKVQII